MPSTDSWSPTPSERRGKKRRPSTARAREGTAGRHFNPARPTFPRTSALRISHFPDPQNRRYNRASDAGRRRASQRCPRPLDDRGSRHDAPGSRVGNNPCRPARFGSGCPWSKTAWGVSPRRTLERTAGEGAPRFVRFRSFRCGPLRAAVPRQGGGRVPGSGKVMSRVGAALVDVDRAVPGQRLVRPDRVELNPVGLGLADQVEGVVDGSR
jgi:hypothetical protein